MLKSIQCMGAHEQLSPRSKLLLRYTANSVNTFMMACALIGYTLLTIEKCFNNIPLGISAFIPFVGITLYVIDKVDTNVIDFISKKQLPYYLQPKGNCIILALASLLTAYYGIFSSATSLYLTDRYVGNQTWYNDYKESIITPSTEAATTIFNTYPTIFIFSSVIMKKLASLTDQNIAKMCKLETKFRLFNSTIKEINETETLVKIKEQIMISDDTRQENPYVV